MRSFILSKEIKSVKNSLGFGKSRAVAFVMNPSVPSDPINSWVKLSPALSFVP